MHPTLKVNEILHLIFSEFQNEPGGPYVLATLARTCKTFKDIALDLLWQELDDLHRFFALLPSDSWSMKQQPTLLPRSSYPFGHSYRPLLALVLHRPPLLEDWTSCLEYGARVKRLVIKPGRDYHEVHPSTIASIPQEFVLFPRLQYFSCDFQGISTGFYHMFLTPTLSELRFLPDLTSYNAFAQIFMDNISQKAPNLRKLVVGLSNWDDHIRPRPTIGIPACPLANQAVTNLRTLRHLECPQATLSVDSLRRLGLPEQQLETLAIRNDVEELALSVQHKGAFPALRSLSIRCGELQSFRVLLRRVPLSALQELAINYIQPIPPLAAELQELFEAMAQSLPPCQLTSVIVNHFGKDIDYRDDQLPYDEFAIRGYTLEPLYAFPNITKFRINFASPYDFNDNDIKELTRSWRGLKILCLGDWSASWKTIGVSLEGLSHFAAHCPALEALTLQLCTDDIPSTAGKPLPAGGRECSKLKYLSVLASELDNSEEVDDLAMYLSSIFPSLAEISARDISLSWGGSEWENVIGRVRRFATVRMQERAHWTKEMRVLAERLD